MSFQVRLMRERVTYLFALDATRQIGFCLCLRICFSQTLLNNLLYFFLFTSTQRGSNKLPFDFNFFKTCPRDKEGLSSL